MTDVLLRAAGPKVASNAVLTWRHHWIHGQDTSAQTCHQLGTNCLICVQHLHGKRN